LRRRFKAAFPVFLLALLVQVFAPGWGGLATRADASGMAPECSVMADGAASRQQTPTGQHHNADHQCCLFCHVPHAVDPAPMAAAFAVPTPLTRSIAWTVDPALVPLAHAGKNAQARAPPSFS
jgi:hypothetical protein